jgi:hypothetical protein
MQERFGNSAPRGAKPVAGLAGADMVVESLDHARHTPSATGRKCGTCKTKHAEEASMPNGVRKASSLTCMGRADGDVRLDA